MNNNKSIFSVGMTNDNQITITSQNNPDTPVLLDIHNAEHLSRKLQLCIEVLKDDNPSKIKDEDMMF
jgi:hypothetical protein